MTQQNPSMSGHTPQPECLICRMWEQMPYAKRHTTPISCQEGEGCLIVGFWLRSRHPPDQAIRYCQRHAATMAMMDDRQAAQDKAKADALAQAASPEALRAMQLRGRVAEMAAKAVPQAAPVVPPLISPPVLPVIGPATREVFATVQPGQVVTTDPLPNVPKCTCTPPVAGTTYCDHCRHQVGCPVHISGCPKSPSFGSANIPAPVDVLLQAYQEPADTLLGAGTLAADIIKDRQIPSLLDSSPPSFNEQIDSILQDGLPEAKEEPKAEPAKFPCPMCGKQTFSGDIHVCS